MDVNARTALNSVLPQLIQTAKINEHFKDLVCASGLFDEGFLNGQLKTNVADDEFLFRVVRQLRRANELEDVLKLSGILKETGSEDAATLLDENVLRGNMRESGVQASSVGEIKNTRASEYPGAGVSQSQPASNISQKDSPSAPSIREAQDKIMQSLPPPKMRNEGDLALLKEYCEAVHYFAQRKTDKPPGPLQVPNAERKTISANDLWYLPPDCCSLLSEMYGRVVPTLRFSTHRKHPVLSALDGTRKFCLAIVIVQPGDIISHRLWISINRTLLEGIGDCVLWERFTARRRKHKHWIDLNLTGEEWYLRNGSNAIEVLRESGDSSNSNTSGGKSTSTREKQGALASLGRRVKTVTGTSTRVSVMRNYMDGVTGFAEGSSDTELGPLKSPQESSGAYHESRLCSITPEHCATIVDLFGGEPSLFKGTQNGCLALKNSDGKTKFLGVVLYAGPTGAQIGSYYINWNMTLSEAVASSVGYFPSKATNPKTGDVVDVNILVSKWFEEAPQPRLFIWD